MFSKSITSSSQFLMMSLSAQALYFHLGMNADDDGFVEHFAIMRMVEAKPDDLRVLAAKNFVRVFDEKVLVITDWKENNYLRNDRYTPSKYLEIYKEELAGMSSGTPLVYQMDTQVRLGEVREGKTKQVAYTEEFVSFWESYPKKTAKPEAFKAWRRESPDLSAVLKSLPRFKESDQWRRGFIPNPATFINQRRWEDEVESSPSESPIIWPA